MKSVGEAMSIGRSFNESLQKGFSSLEYGCKWVRCTTKNQKMIKIDTIEELKLQSSQRLLLVGQALRKDIHLKKFIKQLNMINGLLIKLMI